MNKATRFQYRQRTPEDIQARATNKGGAFDSWIKPAYKMYKVKEGKNVVRFLPPTWDEANHYGFDVYINYNIGVDNGRYLSLSKMGKGRDPIAEALSQARREGDEKLAKDLAPKYSVLAWVIDRTAEDEGPMLFRMPFTFDRDLAGLSSDEDTKETFYIDRIDEGHDIRFYANGAGKQRCEYSKFKLLAPSPLSQDQGQADEWLQYVDDNPVPDCLQFYSYEHIANVFNGGQQKRPDEDVDDDEDQSAKPKAATARGNGEAARARPVSKPPFDDDDDEGEEATPPPQKAQTSVSGGAGGGGSIRERLAARHKVAPKRAELDDED